MVMERDTTSREARSLAVGAYLRPGAGGAAMGGLGCGNPTGGITTRKQARQQKQAVTVGLQRPGFAAAAPARAGAPHAPLHEALALRVAQDAALAA